MQHTFTCNVGERERKKERSEREGEREVKEN